MYFLSNQHNTDITDIYHFVGDANILCDTPWFKMAGSLQGRRSSIPKKNVVISIMYYHKE